MERLTEFLKLVHERGLVPGRFRGLCHVVIGRRISGPAGLVSHGITWRELAILLRDLRFDKQLAAEVGAHTDEAAPRDRQRFWYSVIALARPDSVLARTEADSLIPLLQSLGYTIGPAPAPPSPPSLSSPPKPTETESEATDAPPPRSTRKKKK